MAGQTDAFSRPWIFLRAVPSLDLLPPEGPPEIAFAGRSNVGKSSLINALLGQKALARTSNTPGRTQQLNYFIPEPDAASETAAPPFAIVDMPGYGYARAPRNEVAKWTRLVLGYLKGRATLKRVYLLVDARHGLKENDRKIMETLDKAAVSYQLVLTKTDKVNLSELQRVTESTIAAMARNPAAFPEIIATSAEKHRGLDELRAAIAASVHLD